MTGNTVLVFTLGRMADSTKVIGTTVSSMAKEFTANQTEWNAGDAGKKVKESPGLMSLAPTHNNNDKVLRQQHYHQSDAVPALK